MSFSKWLKAVILKLYYSKKSPGMLVERTNFPLKEQESTFDSKALGKDEFFQNHDISLQHTAYPNTDKTEIKKK
jgi:hypothetical protein